MRADGAEQPTCPIHLFNSQAISPDSQNVLFYTLQPGLEDSGVVLFIRGIDDLSGTTVRQLTSYSPTSAGHMKDSRSRNHGHP